MKRSSGMVVAGAFVALVSLQACNNDDEGDAAPVVYPVPECGEPLFHRDTPMRRLPYLQDVQRDALRVIFTATEEADAYVEYATDPDGDWVRVEGAPEFFPTSRTDDVVDYWAFETRLEGLDDGRTYCYRVGLGDELVAEGLSFTTAWRDENRPVRILALGDSGRGSAEQIAVRDQFMQHEFDVFLHLGDMAYNDGTFSEFEAHMFQVYEDFLHATPSWPTMGNHEAKTNNGQPYLDVYYLPEVARAEVDQERYYSFDYGNVHFVSVESNELILGLATAQDQLGAGDQHMLAWLRDDLAASDADWKIAFFHHPPYTSSSSREASMLVRNGLLPILEEGGVDIALAGHDHFYERSQPIWQGEVAEGDSRAITYIIAGFGGTGMTETVDGNWHTAAIHDESQGYVDLQIAGCTATGTVMDLNGEQVDDFVIDGCD